MAVLQHAHPCCHISNGAVCRYKSYQYRCQDSQDLSGMGIRTLVDVISLTVARLVTSMVEVGVGWRAPQQAPPIKFWMSKHCFFLGNGYIYSLGRMCL